MKATAARVLLTGLFVVALSSGCARPAQETVSEPAEPGTAASSEPAMVTDSNGMRPGVFPTTRVEPPSDADRPDGPPPTADSDLTVDDLVGLLRTSASAKATADSCTAGDVRLSLSDAEPAAGHRYAQLTATNTSTQRCRLIGWPGIGLRGAWGTSFPTVAERMTGEVNRVGVPEPDPQTAVLVPAGGRAVAEFEWTGALAGNRDEHASLVVVQLAAGQDPATLTVDAIDIGPETTVRVGPWGRAG